MSPTQFEEDIAMPSIPASGVAERQRRAEQRERERRQAREQQRELFPERINPDELLGQIRRLIWAAEDQRKADLIERMRCPTWEEDRRAEHRRMTLLPKVADVLAGAVLDTIEQEGGIVRAKLAERLLGELIRCGIWRQHPPS